MKKHLFYLNLLDQQAMSSQKGVWYVKDLVKVCQARAHDTSVLELLSLVSDNVIFCS